MYLQRKKNKKKKHACFVCSKIAYILHIIFRLHKRDDNTRRTTHVCVSVYTLGDVASSVMMVMRAEEGKMRKVELEGKKTQAQTVA